MIIEKKDISSGELFGFVGFEFLSIFRQFRKTDIVMRELKDPDALCPLCLGKVSTHGRTKSQITDIPWAGNPVMLNVTFIRYVCKEPNCKVRTFTLNRKGYFCGQLSLRLRMYIEEKCLLMPFSRLASECGLSESCIRGICEELIDGLERRHKIGAPKYISIDGVNLNGGKDLSVRASRVANNKRNNKVNRIIVSDSLSGAVIDVLSEDKRESLTECLLDIPGGSRIDNVVIDMDLKYKEAVKIALGDRVNIVIDRWHVVKKISDDFKKCLPNRHHRNHEHLQIVDSFLMKQDINVFDPELFSRRENWTSQDLELKGVYEDYQRFLKLYDCPNALQAERYYDAWLSELCDKSRKEFENFTNTFSRWRKEIFGYWRRGSMITVITKDRKEKIIAKLKSSPNHKELLERLLKERRWVGFTNGKAERRNQAIRQVNNAGRSYSFKVLRARLIYSSHSYLERFSICCECLRVAREKRGAKSVSRSRRLEALIGGDGKLANPKVSIICGDCAQTEEFIGSRSDSCTRAEDEPLENWIQWPSLRHIWAPTDKSLRECKTHMEGVYSRAKRAKVQLSGMPTDEVGLAIFDASN